MKRFVFSGIVILGLCFMAGSGFSAENEFPDGKQLAPNAIVKQIDAIRSPANSFIFDVKITSYKNQTKISQQTLNVMVRDADKSLVRFLSPAAMKGRVLLMKGNNMWIYLPGTREPIRISPQQRLLGQVSNGDVARVVYSIDYEAKILSSSFEGERIQLELSAKNNDVSYNKILLSVDMDDYHPQKAEFYASSGKLLKTAFYKGYTMVLERERPMFLEIYDALRKNEYSVMEYSNFKIVETPSAYFQKNYLKNLGR